MKRSIREIVLNELLAKIDRYLGKRTFEEQMRMAEADAVRIASELNELSTRLWRLSGLDNDSEDMPAVPAKLLTEVDNAVASLEQAIDELMKFNAEDPLEEE